jgi:hypothetical protein
MALTLFQGSFFKVMEYKLISTGMLQLHFCNAFNLFNQFFII